MERYKRPHTADGWHFLTGTEASIGELTKAVGFRYELDTEIQQFAHGAAIEVLTPKGTIARYFYGIEYSPRDIRFGVIDAAEERIGSALDQVLLLCYHYDPSTGKYGATVLGLVADRRGCDRRRLPRIPDRQPSAGTCEKRGPRRDAPRKIMFTNFPFFPQQASTQASQVDAVYFFLVAVTAFFSLLIATLIVVFVDQVPPAGTNTRSARRFTARWRSR